MQLGFITSNLLKITAFTSVGFGFANYNLPLAPKLMVFDSVRCSVI